MTLGGELLAYGMAQDLAQLDEKAFLEVFQPGRPRPAAKKKASGAAAFETRRSNGLETRNGVYFRGPFPSFSFVCLFPRLVSFPKSQHKAVSFPVSFAIFSPC
jgi:hypothetical protein